jgi:hypothetical protein
VLIVLLLSTYSDSGFKISVAEERVGDVGDEVSWAACGPRCTCDGASTREAWYLSAPSRGAPLYHACVAMLLAMYSVPMSTCDY